AGALIHKNHERSKHEGPRIRPTIGSCGGNYDRWECDRRVKNDEGSRDDVKRKSAENKVRHEKAFEVDEAIDGENSRASSFQVRGNDGDKI
ncbi:hypothetical protein Tco_1164687, partial [Tanacetum coccineum]